MSSILKKGDIIGIVTPSSPAAGIFPERFIRGINQIKNMGFQVNIASHAKTVSGQVAAKPIERAQDINEMFANKKISAILTTLGGNHSCELLPYLDWYIISKNPKPFIGYSDITVLHHAIAQRSKQIVYYGPTLLTEFAEFPNMPYESNKFFSELFLKEKQSIKIFPFRSIAGRGYDWSNSKPVGKIFHDAPNLVKIRPGKASGVILGGCIEALERLRGTPYWPDLSGALLFLESSKENYDSILWEVLIADYYNMGVWEKVSGIILGNKNWTQNEINHLSSIFYKVTINHPIPIIFGLPFGHISPIVTIPMYGLALLNADDGYLLINTNTRFSYSPEKKEE